MSMVYAKNLNQLGIDEWVYDDMQPEEQKHLFAYLTTRGVHAPHWKYGYRVHASEPLLQQLNHQKKQKIGLKSGAISDRQRKEIEEVYINSLIADFLQEQTEKTAI